MKLQFIKNELLRETKDAIEQFDLIPKDEAKAKGSDFWYKQINFIRDVYKLIKIKLYLVDNQIYETDLDDFFGNLTGDPEAFMIRTDNPSSLKFLFPSAIIAFEIISLSEEEFLVQMKAAEEMKIVKKVKENKIVFTHEASL